MFSDHTSLTVDERRLLSGLDSRPVELRANELLVQSGRRTDAFYLVERGWLFEHLTGSDGRRQVTRYFHTGDLVMLEAVAFERSPVTIQAATDVALRQYPIAAFDTLVADAPRVLRLVLMLNLIAQSTLLDRLRCLGRMTALERFAYLLLELLARFRLVDPDVTDTIDMPMPQHVLGDLLGLTNVHVSRTLVRLESLGLLERNGDRWRLPREAALADMVDFIDRGGDSRFYTSAVA